MADLKEFLTTHKTWTVLWILVAIFWIVGFSFGCSQLAHSKIYDGRPFFAELFGPQPPRKGHHDDDDDDNVYNEIRNRNFPGWLVCPGLPTDNQQASNVTSTCTQCIFSTSNSTDLECDDKINIPGIFDPQHTNCYVFNGFGTISTVPTPMPNRSIVNCDFALNNTARVRFYVFDQNWFAQKDNRWLFPDGIVQRTFPVNTRNLVELSRSKYNFGRGGKVSNSFFSYQLMDGESYPLTTQNGNASLMLYYGTPSEWRYTQYPYSKVFSGFGFYSWISYIGGLTFFCYFVQVGVYMLICKVMGWDNDTANTYQDVN